VDMTTKAKYKRNKNKLGRPRLPRGATRPHRIVTFVTDDELTRIERIVKDSNKSLSAVCHELLVKNLSSPLGEGS